MKWTLWDKQKPRNGQECLVVVGTENRYLGGGPVVIAEYDGAYRDGGGMWYWQDGESGYYDSPCRTYCNASGTYWAPVPEPPK